MVDDVFVNPYMRWWTNSTRNRVCLVIYYVMVGMEVVVGEVGVGELVGVTRSLGLLGRPKETQSATDVCRVGDVIALGCWWSHPMVS